MDSVSFILFGATGDLAKRKIFPALYNLFLDEKLTAPFSIIGLSRREWTDEVFQLHVKESLSHFSRRFSEEENRLAEFLQAFRYCALDVTSSADYEPVLNLIESREEELGIQGNRLFYLSVAPEFFDIIASNIQERGIGTSKGWKRLVIEKPFGHDLASAQQLNEKLSTAFREEEIYRIDHYLGKQMVQNLESLKLANPIFQSLWNNQNISSVQITASETVGVEERANYYDRAGAIRDMFQNHMLQLLMMTAMQFPEQIGPEYIRHEKRKIMKSLRPLTKENVAFQVIRGQYDSGEINGKQVAAYKEEPGVESSSINDTFIAARLWIDDPSWRGVPFYIRTGKRMEKKSTKIVIEFKNTLRDLQESHNEKATPNLLIIEISPNESVSLQLNLKNPLNYGQAEPVTLHFSAPGKDVPEAYESLIYDALRGDPTFFAHWKEVELSWNWVQPVLEAFAENILPLYSYPAGSMGPKAAHQLLEEDGFKWW
ncbi:glucose-6-phosphate dehydrogenase [Bacillus sp. FJAT-27231]|uniref:glucose-6-phosphate dehydrogenase n=1 Tax=Bacillus sp. FJAT-27231 TaxID=1679168 RepID=UPI0006715F5F|nr:glucose-6-phosphate dehydrogenase [Bacillus sp. FJAT-27231]KMY56124.1 glucose-6-phosphate dehydrogenase [Bacillus sp. FJAT-27231]